MPSMSTLKPKWKPCHRSQPGPAQPPSEAAECVKAFKPRIVYPYHFRGQDPKEFQKALEGSGVEVRILEWYPAT